MTLQKSITDLMREEREKWAVSTKVYATINVVIRTFLIIASGLVAAEQIFKTDNSPVRFLENWIPIFALLVAILTSFDAWIKPRDKWRGFMEDRDDLDSLINRAQLIQNDDATALAQLDNEFKELRSRHRKNNVF